MGEGHGDVGDSGRFVAHAGRDAMIAGRDLTINNLFQGMPPMTARSAYPEQVRRIAPPDPPGLRDRDAELAELARFCLDPDGPSYAWWRAGPWAGKSALLSTFVLRPPPEVAERVRIVSFFITARLAAQDTRDAFTEVLAEQLAALLGQSLPTASSEATREAYLLGLLSQAASECEDAGGRLVLVVDGLDEDRGVTTGPDAHSIAGLLPADPPAGMRVIVAGRPNPPVPDDVPDFHPLRDPASIRTLAASPHARDVQRLGRQELQRLLRGSQAEQDMLGLLAAARGGLTARDLADLSGAPLWEVEDILRTAAGRTLQGRLSLLNFKARPEVYLLGHEELQAAATDYLSDRIHGYRDRLHAWASRWHARRWPPETPEYLLTGYFRLLDDLDDLPRMTELAADVARHDRMLDLTGGDAAALAEARATLDRIATSDHPDLASALALACHRDHLIDRNANIPTSLPAVWAVLGHLSRAEALVTSITSPDRQAEALAEVARALARTGQHQQAEAIATRAQTVACSITDPDSQVNTLIPVAAALAQAGQHQQAEAIARSITHPYWRARAQAAIAAALAQTGQPQQAQAVDTQAQVAARTITDPDAQARAQAAIAAALAQAGQYQQAQAAARTITHPYWQAHALADVAGALAQAGQPQQAEAIATQAEALARTITHSAQQSGAMADVAAALAQAGQHQQAQAVARTITNPYSRAGALAAVAAALAQGGQHQRAEALARSITDSGARAGALADVSAALARSGQHQQAEALARSITNPYSQAVALAEVAGALAQAGQHQRAEAIATRAEMTIRSITDSGARARALAEVAGALAQAGQHQRAEAIATRAEAAARLVTNSASRAQALAAVAGALARAGQHQRAEALARSITDPRLQANALAAVAEALPRSGQHQQAEALARSITDPYLRAEALARVACELAKAGEADLASRVAAATCAVGQWTRAVGPVLLLVPSAYATLARTLEELRGQDDEDHSDQARWT